MRASGGGAGTCGASGTGLGGGAASGTVDRLTAANKTYMLFFGVSMLCALGIITYVWAESSDMIDRSVKIGITIGLCVQVAVMAAAIMAISKASDSMNNYIGIAYPWGIKLLLGVLGLTLAALALYVYFGGGVSGMTRNVLSGMLGALSVVCLAQCIFYTADAQKVDYTRIQAKVDSMKFVNSDATFSSARLSTEESRRLLAWAVNQTDEIKANTKAILIRDLASDVENATLKQDLSLLDLASLQGIVANMNGLLADKKESLKNYPEFPTLDYKEIAACFNSPDEQLAYFVKNPDVDTGQFPLVSEDSRCEDPYVKRRSVFYRARATGAPNVVQGIKNSLSSAASRADSLKDALVN